MQKLVVLTGAGMSAESGISTFRDAGGLWEGHDVMEVASPQGFESNPELVLEFYNQRRRQLKEVEPNLGHHNLAKLEEHFDVEIITQNIDDLHERAGSSEIIHLHGELRKARSVEYPELIYYREDDIVLGDVCEKGAQLRPHIVWFGESVPMIEKAIDKVEQADILVIIGTSMQVYPAAGLVDLIQPRTPIYFIDPNPNISESRYRNLTIIKEGAGKGTEKLLNLLID
jgi:NAD-dependent deacetylase